MTHSSPVGWQRQLAAQALKGLDLIERRLNPLRSRLQKDPYYRFRTLAEAEAAARLGVRIDVSHATVDDWLRLPGLSIHQARTLAALAQSGVPLLSIEDIAAALNLPAHRLQPFSPILDFRYYDEDLSLAQPLNLNRASGPQLMQIPGITADFVQQLLHHRQLGPYRSWEDVQHRLRLAPEQVAKLIHYLRV